MDDLPFVSGSASLLMQGAHLLVDTSEAAGTAEETGRTRCWDRLAHRIEVEDQSLLAI